MRRTNRARGNHTGSGCGARPAARGRPTRRSWRWRIRGWGAPGGGTPSGRSRSIPSRGAWRPERGIDARAWGAPCSMRPRGWRARWPWRGGQVMRNRGRRSSSVRPRRGCCVGCRAPSGRGGRPLTDIDGRGRALRSGDGRGCGGLAVSGGGDGHAGDGGRRRTDRRCSAAGGAVRSRTAGAAARRAAAPERERRGTAGDQPAPAGTQHLRRVLAHGRCRVCVGCTRSPRPQEATASLCISMTRPNAGNRPKYPTFNTRGLGSA